MPYTEHQYSGSNRFCGAQARALKCCRQQPWIATGSPLDASKRKTEMLDHSAHSTNQAEFIRGPTCRILLYVVTAVCAPTYAALCSRYLYRLAVNHGRPASSPVEVTVRHDLLRGFSQLLLLNIQIEPRIMPLPYPAKSFVQWGMLEQT